MIASHKNQATKPQENTMDNDNLTTDPDAPSDLVTQCCSPFLKRFLVLTMPKHWRWVRRKIGGEWTHYGSVLNTVDVWLPKDAPRPASYAIVTAREDYSH